MKALLPRFAKQFAGSVLVLFAAAVAAAAPARYILETRPGVDARPLAAQYRFTIQKSWNGAQHASFLIQPIVAFTAADLKALARETGVLEVEPDSAIHAGGPETSSLAVEPLTEQLLPRPPATYFGATVRASYVDQPASRIIGLASARNGYPAGTGVTVAVIDTGIDERHPALRNAILPGYDFTRDLPGTANELADLAQSTVAILDQSTVAILDCKWLPVRLNQSTVAILDQSTVAILDSAHPLPAAFGHGTMVAGLVHLVAPGARILPLKAFRADGSSSLSDIVRAIYYAADHGANVISMSFSFDANSVEVTNAIDYAAKKGVLLVASTGNDGKEKKLYPAALPKVLGVGSTNYSDRRSPFSNYGETASVSAPGEAVITTYPGNNYAGVWGTSFSTPMVAGALAILKQIDAKLTYSDAKDLFEHGVFASGDVGRRLSLPQCLGECSRFSH